MISFTTRYGMRIKVDSDATDASVSGITYIGNSISANDKYGYLITQSYSEDCRLPCIRLSELRELTGYALAYSWNSRNREHDLVS